MKVYKLGIGLTIMTFLLILLWQNWLSPQLSEKENQAQIIYNTAILAQRPCLGNVCPGFIGREEAISELVDLDFVQGSILGDTQIGLLFFDGNIDQVRGSGRVYFAEDLIRSSHYINRMLFSLDNLTLGTVLGILGEPEEFLFVSGCGMGNRVYAKLLYLGQGIEINIEYPARNPSSQRLVESTPVAGIMYFLPDNHKAQIIASLKWYMTETVAYDLAPNVTEGNILDQIRLWSGLNASLTPSTDFCPR